MLKGHSDRNIGMVEEDVFLRQAVKGRGLDHRVTISSGMRPNPVANGVAAWRVRSLGGAL